MQCIKGIIGTNASVGVHEDEDFRDADSLREKNLKGLTVIIQVHLNENRNATESSNYERELKKRNLSRR